MCKYCRLDTCEKVKDIQFFANGQVKRLEFYRVDVIDAPTNLPPIPQPLVSISSEIDNRIERILETAQRSELAKEKIAG